LLKDCLAIAFDMVVEPDAVCRFGKEIAEEFFSLDERLLANCGAVQLQEVKREQRDFAVIFVLMNEVEVRYSLRVVDNAFPINQQQLILSLRTAERMRGQGSSNQRL
jgi:hypothetical protein